MSSKQQGIPKGPSHESTITSAWWQKDIGSKLTPLAKRIFLEWSGLKEDEIEQRIYAIRDKAWELRKYPCIGQFQFLISRIPYLPEYSKVLERAKHGGTIMDLGCCFGQDLRHLALDGAPTKNLIGLDIDDEFWDMSYDLFNDRGRFEARFIKADILQEPGAAANDPLAEFEGKIDVIIASFFLHLFTWDGHNTALKRMIGLSRPGSLIVGYNIGRPEGKAGELIVGDSQMTGPSHQNPYHHSPETFKAVWKELGEETGTKWEVDARWRPLIGWGLQKADTFWMGPDAVGVEFAATRVA